MSKLKTVALALALALPALAPAWGQSRIRGMTMSPNTGVKTGAGNGVVKAVDPKAGMVTIQHGPIPGIGWPAMTMSFKAATPAVLRAEVGQTVAFQARVSGSDAQVISLRPRR